MIIINLIKFFLFSVLGFLAIYLIFRLQAKAWMHELEKQLDKYLNSKVNNLKKEKEHEKDEFQGQSNS